MVRDPVRLNSEFTFSAVDQTRNLSASGWSDVPRDGVPTLFINSKPSEAIIPRLNPHAPLWWVKEHPNDMVLLDDGTGMHIPFITP
jgi:hypothetical protein